MDDFEEEVMSPPVNNPAQVVEPPTVSFPAAVLLLTKNKKIRRLGWEDKTEYGYLGTDGFVKIFKGGKDYDWMINDGDILAEDWVVVTTPVESQN